MVFRLLRLGPLRDIGSRRNHFAPRRDVMLNWIRGLSDTTQSLLVSVTLGVIVIGFILLIDLIV